MRQLSFGPRIGAAMQIAYVVADLEAAVDYWTDEMGAGPWFCLDNFNPADAWYRGTACDAPANAALGFCGQMNVELIQPLTDNPGVHVETVRGRGYGFHHTGVATVDVDADIDRLSGRGFSVVYQAFWS